MENYFFFLIIRKIVQATIDANSMLTSARLMSK